MPQANLEIVGRTLEAAGREDWNALVEDLDPAVEIEDTDIPDADHYRGREGFFRWLADWSASWEAWRIEDVELRPAGDDTVVALFRMIVKGAGSGIEMERADAMVYSLHGGKIVKVSYYNDQAQALKAAGLSE
jgi:ketosteroid isomerase-like protein